MPFVSVKYHKDLVCFSVTYFASKASVSIPAARGAAALVPVWWAVHTPCKSVLTWRDGKYMYYVLIIDTHEIKRKPLLHSNQGSDYCYATRTRALEERIYSLLNNT